MRLTDRTGLIYERLTVVSRAPNRSATDTNARWVCRCTCGNTTIAYGQDLQRGRVKSCGCYVREKHTRHGMAKTGLYRLWQAMIQRCENPNASNYDRYGGKGITVCERWHDFASFAADMPPRPPGHTLDRIDGNKGYEPGNCRWATYAQQNLNVSRNRYLEHDGKRLTIKEWAMATGLTWQAIDARLRRGWTVERTLTEPRRSNGK